MRRMHQATIPLAAALALCASTVAATASIAATATPSAKNLDVVTCAVDSTVKFSPGLNLQSQQHTITYDVEYKNCTSVTGKPVPAAGSHHGEFVGPRSCLEVPPPNPSMDITVQWDNWANSPSSQINDAYAQGVDAGGQTVHTVSGVVADGQFEGADFKEVIVQTTSPLDCLAPGGVEEQVGHGRVTFTKIDLT